MEQTEESMQSNQYCTLLLPKKQIWQLNIYILHLKKYSWKMEHVAVLIERMYTRMTLLDISTNNDTTLL